MFRKSTEHYWQMLAEAAKREATLLPQGPERDALLRKARQLETASEVNSWLTSPGLRPPIGK